MKFKSVRLFHAPGEGVYRRSHAATAQATKRYRQKNRDKYNQYMREYYARHKEAIALRRHKRTKKYQKSQLELNKNPHGTY